ncbi:MAG: TlpA family protein disulfide reductase [Bacteroidales bacterium]|nr:TlpA family protein disulfide reductase [Bacteroidales bacterium]
MEKIKKYISDFWKKEKSKSLSSKISDIVFLLLVIILLIPPARRELKLLISKLTMNQPHVVAPEKMKTMGNEDFLWPLTKLDGTKYLLENFEGQVIFLNFWATWCPPCRAEMPEIQNLYNRYKDKVRFIFVSFEQPEVQLKFLRDQGYDMPLYTSFQQPPQIFYSKTIPTTYIISRKGEIVVRETGAKKWDGEKTTRLLDKLIAE